MLFILQSGNSFDFVIYFLILKQKKRREPLLSFQLSRGTTKYPTKIETAKKPRPLGRIN
jgi:hypothetical protein